MLTSEERERRADFIDRILDGGSLKEADRADLEAMEEKAAAFDKWWFAKLTARLPEGFR